jgi:hypothetical protein
MTTQAEPTIPDYSGACTANLTPELIKTVMGSPTADWLPESLAGAKQIVMLVLDGLGWNQLESHSHVLPTLAAFDKRSITTVAPTTTVVGLTSLVTGRPPAAHGIVGHRVGMNGSSLDVLKWKLDGVDAEGVDPEEFQKLPAFAANEIPVVTRKMFAGTGFTKAHLQGVRMHGYTVLSSLPVEVWRLLKSGEQLVYAYYEGIDTIAHDRGFGEHYEAELYTVDRLIRDLLAGMPEGSALVVTSDHGQVDVGNRVMDLSADVASHTDLITGEGRFRWLHAKDGEADELLEVAKAEYGELAWVKTKQEIIAEGWFGGPMSEEISARLGDVAVIARENIALREPGQVESHQMICRHGSLTDDEVLVPLAVQRV